MVWGSNPGGSEVVCTCIDLLCVPPSLLYNGYWASVRGVKWLGSDFTHPISFSAEVKKRVEPYLYFPSGLSWYVIEQNLHLHLSFSTSIINHLERIF
jgi:hypothetical protein